MLSLALYLSRVRSSEVLGGESPDGVAARRFEPNVTAGMPSAATLMDRGECHHVRRKRVAAWASGSFDGQRGLGRGFRAFRQGAELLLPFDRSPSPNGNPIPVTAAKVTGEVLLSWYSSSGLISPILRSADVHCI